MKIKNLFFLTILCIINFSSFAKDNENKKVITFATEATYPPFETVAPSGELQGFDIDIANSICEKLKAKCVFLNQPFDSLIVNLQIGKFDAIIAAMSITPDRQKVVNFTNPYYINSLSFIARKDINFDITPGKFKNKTVGVQQGTTFANYLNKVYGKNINVKTYVSTEMAFLDLANGRIDTVMGDTPLLKVWMQDHGNDQYHFIGNPITDSKLLGVGNGIAVNKNNKQLLNSFNKAIEQIRKDGTMKKIENKYFAR
ncbi:MAG TPA: transporter substrate-binding domain-containing protein [Burkholderiales bacterium]|nr:transporter substrate-binding domain-containing protein [Burkholderiales bacterium]